MTDLHSPEHVAYRAALAQRMAARHAQYAQYVATRRPPLNFGLSFDETCEFLERLAPYTH